MIEEQLGLYLWCLEAKAGTTMGSCIYMLKLGFTSLQIGQLWTLCKMVNQTKQTTKENSSCNNVVPKILTISQYSFSTYLEKYN